VHLWKFDDDADRRAHWVAVYANKDFVEGFASKFRPLLAAKKLEVLHELLPDASVVAMLVNPANPSVEPETRATQDARSLGVQLHILRASTAGEIDAAFASLAKLRARALVVSDDCYFLNQRAQVMALAARHAVPTISGRREFPVAGGLVSYGSDLADAYRQVGLYAGKILEGIRAADLPVQQVVKIEMSSISRPPRRLALPSRCHSSATPTR
jgi:putative tryptophan/tyrosine transport system substrate-binding protein